jgi:hypothetical protein
MSETCRECGKPLTHVVGKRAKEYCSNVCKLRAARKRAKDSRAALEYTAKNIKVMSGQEIQESMPWFKAARLAAEYPQRPQEFILRGVIASEHSGLSTEYFEKRYLQEDKTIPENPYFTAAYKQLIEDARQEQWGMK